MNIKELQSLEKLMNIYNLKKMIFNRKQIKKNKNKWSLEQNI